jgi:oligoribonuclease
MAQNQNYLIWIDMEMTGLVPDTDRVIEVALVITDNNLETIAEAPVLVLHQPDSVLDGMDAWNKSTHAKSGLIEKVKASTLDEAMVEEQMVEFLKEYVPIRTSPMCGNSICQDRRFLARWMPKFEDYFHYRNLDGYGAGCQKARQTRGAGRHLRIDQRDEALSGTLYQAVSGVYGLPA